MEKGRIVISNWDDAEAAGYVGDLEQRVYSSRLLGRDPSLVLHGGGNTSVKSLVRNIFGEDEEVLFVKGSGWDLETIEAGGFAPCRMRDLLRLAELPELSDTDMTTELRKSMVAPNAPAPSVEAILHAILPARFVDHTHADAVLAITNTAIGLERAREVWGDRVVVIPYVMPGFKLARLCAELFPQQVGPNTIGMLLMNHGMFSFGDTARESYERMIELVTAGEEYLERNGAGSSVPLGDAPAAPGTAGRAEIAQLRRDLSDAAGAPMILSVQSDAEALAFANRPDISTVSQQGPATPDHVIRTKQVPMVGRDVGAYVAAYEAYFAAHGGDKALTMLDPAPRVVLDPVLGLGTAGRSAKDAAIVADVYRRTMGIIARATALGGWQALPAADIFDVEYWDLEQAKLRKAGAPAMFAGEICLVTGAASGIGKACVASLMKRGAAVIGLDLDPAVEALHGGANYRGITCDVADEGQLGAALDAGVRAFGGLDMLVLNAGIFPASTPIASLPGDLWRTTMAINLDANLALLREAHPLLKLAPRGGRVVVIGSKNVPAPGPGAAAYSASKAALQQLARVAALEWGADGIRINTLHPNAVFDTALWTPAVLEARAASYGLSVEDYKTSNLLKAEVTSSTVAELAAELCGPLFAATTGAQIPVDGGNERVI
jgi:rhamnose utilization protein RhaD (predicted bifunctional aldolase and dehydrogenase)/NAD(P)-dependent dehydrogenase (short-subunit alcohol dehydrogenase family)